MPPIPFHVTGEEKCGRVGVQLIDNGTVFYMLDGERVNWFFSTAETADGERISTLRAKRLSCDCKAATCELGTGRELHVRYEENALELEQIFFMPEDGAWLSVQAILKDKARETVTRRISPIVTPYPDHSGKKVFLSLDQKMLQVPYDNDMWSRYESTPPHSGRTSYEVTAIYDESTLQGWVVGAVDQEVWKNAIAWSLEDHNSITAYSGAADWGTHDVMPHGCLNGETVASSRFILLWTEDVRRGMEAYADLCLKVHPRLEWKGGVPFGYNTYAGLGGGLTLEAWQDAGDFIDELKDFGDEEGVTYINLDGSFGLDQDRIRQMVKDFHKRGQKVGTYAAPFVGHIFGGLDQPLSGENGLTLRDLILKDDKGRPIQTIGHFFPLDASHPAWERYARAQMRNVSDMGFDYLKIDFLSHGSLEGIHADSTVKTGRMAMNKGYRIIVDELSKADRPIFISLSISPLFPFGYGHARRCCCDTFGHHDDVRYVLNAVNFAWWANGRLYQYNDPDHIVLCNSVIDRRGQTTLQEARSRYNTAVIAGTVMLLSDNYVTDETNELAQESRRRAYQFTQNHWLNALARLGKSFEPIELRDGTSQVYFSKSNGKHYLAVFNFKNEPQTIAVEALRANLPCKGSALDLNRGTTWKYSSMVSTALEPYDSAILEIESIE